MRSRKIALLLASGVLFAQTSRDLVLHIEVNLVQVDAVVTDSKGRPVTDLTAADFEIRQDGKLQTIKNFSYIDTSEGTAHITPPRSTRKNSKDAPLPPPVDLKPGDVRRTFAIVVDDLGIAWENFPTLKKALREFVERDKQPNDLVAILKTGGGMGVFQQFTTDPKELLAAIDHLQYNFTFSRRGIESFRSLGTPGAPRNPELGFASRIGTMQAITATIRGLNNLPGRKVMLVISESLAMLQDDRYVEQIGDHANRASVVIYGLDPRGLPTLQLTAADNTGNLTPQQISQVPFDRATRYFESQSGLYYLAQQTGGLFFHDNNDLGGGVRKVSADSSGYYLIGYQPDADTFRSRTRQSVFRKLQVRVKRKGLHVRSRAGFFSVPTRPPDPTRIPIKLRTRQGQIESAFDSPFSSEAIHVRLTGRFVEGADRGLWIQGLLHIEAKDLKFAQQPDGKYHAAAEIVTMVNGDVLPKPDYHSDIVNMQLDPRTYEAAMRQGITCTIQRHLDKPGFYQLKVVLRDNDSQQIGSASQFIEVPDLSKRLLTLSGIVMSGENDKTTPANPQQGATPQVADDDRGTGPAVRIFSHGSKVLFGYQILNASLSDRNQPDISVETRVFHDGKEVYAGAPTPLDFNGQTDMTQLAAANELTLGSGMEPGEYVLQVIVTDNLAPKKTAIATQSTDFEILADRSR